MFIGFIGFIFIQDIRACASSGLHLSAVAWIWIYKFIQKEGSERCAIALFPRVQNNGAPAELNWRASCPSRSSSSTPLLNWWPGALPSMPCSAVRDKGHSHRFVLVPPTATLESIRASIWTDAAQS